MFKYYLICSSLYRAPRRVVAALQRGWCGDAAAQPPPPGQVVAPARQELG